MLHSFFADFIPLDKIFLVYLCVSESTSVLPVLKSPLFQIDSDFLMYYSVLNWYYPFTNDKIQNKFFVK